MLQNARATYRSELIVPLSQALEAIYDHVVEHGTLPLPASNRNENGSAAIHHAVQTALGVAWEALAAGLRPPPGGFAIDVEHDRPVQRSLNLGTATAGRRRYVPSNHGSRVIMALGTVAVTNAGHAFAGVPSHPSTE